MVASRPIAGRINRWWAPDGGTASRCATPSHASRAVGSRTVSQPPPDRELWTCHLRQPLVPWAAATRERERGKERSLGGREDG